MNRVNELLCKALFREGIFFLTPSEALDLIRVCQNEERVILGIDAFILTETTTQPISEDSIDYSTDDSVCGNWNEAKEFIEQRRNKGYYFEVVLCKGTEQA